MSREVQGRVGGTSAAAQLDYAPAPAAGKATLTEGLDHGAPLPDAQRTKFEKSTGADLSGVKVHTDGVAADKADGVGARAFAVGNDIAFAKGEYNPGTPGGEKLLAHEVAHTVQQRGAAPTKNPTTTTPGDKAETNADAAAGAMAQGEAATVSSEPMAVARKTTAEAPAATPAATEGNAAGETKAGEGGDLTVDRVGQVPDEGDDVVADIKDNNSEGAKQALASGAKQLPEQGGADEVEGGVKADAAAAGGGGDDGPVSPEVTASIVSAQSDTKEAMAAAEGESAAYKAEMRAQRDRFDAEQNATMLEQVKAMSTDDKRSTLVEMGYDKKAVKKMKDAELASIIEGKMTTEARKTKILGMDPEELAALSPDRKIQYLVDLGIDRKDLDKVGQQRAAQLFDDIMRVARVPGTHKVKIKIKGGLLSRSWEVTVKCDAEGNTDITAEKKGGFLSKLWGWVKVALPIILMVLAPLTAGATLIILAVYQTATAIANGDWLGAIVGAAGAFVGVGAFMAAKGALGAASTFSKIADVAKKVQKVAEAARDTLNAAKAKNAGGLLAALSSGAAAFAGVAAKSAEKFSATMEKWSGKLKKWSGVISGGEKVAKGIKTGDPIAAIGGAFDTAAASVNPTGTNAKNLQHASSITNLAGAGKRAMSSSPPNYGAVAEAALGIAGTLTDNNKVEDAARIVAAATRLKSAWDNRATNPAGLAEAAFDVAGAIHTAKYDYDRAGDKDAGGKPEVDTSREAIVNGYQRASRIVRAAGSALTAATAKPRPNYLGALDAATQLIAEFTEDKRLDSAAVLTSRLDAWTAAVSSKDERAIIAAGAEFGEAINGMRDSIQAERDRKKEEAKAKLGPDEALGDDGGGLPPGPGVSELDPSTIGTVVPAPTVPVAPDAEPTPTLRFEEEITVRPEPPEGTPRFEEEITVRPAPKSGLNVTVPKTPPKVTPTPKKETRELSEEVKSLVNVVKAFAAAAKDAGHPSFEQAIKTFETAVGTIEKWMNAETSVDLYTAAVSVLQTAKQARTFQRIFWTEWNAYQTQLGNGLSVSKETIQAFGRSARNLGRVARAAEIPLTINSITDDIIVACGYNKDLSGAEVGVVDRLTAAGSLVGNAMTLGTDVTWVVQMGRAILAKLGENSAVAAINIVRYKVNTFGSAIAKVVMEFIEPALTKLAATKGAPEATKLAQRIFTALAEWEPTYRAIRTSVLFESASKLLGGKLVTALRWSTSWPVAIGYEIAKLEAQFADKLYRDALASTSLFFSAGLFGSPINAVKNEIRSKPKTSGKDCDAFFNYAFHTFLSGAPSRVRGNWLPFARKQLHGHVPPSFDGQIDYAPDPTPVLQSLPIDDLKMIAADTLQAAALTFLDDEFRKEFKHEPTATLPAGGG